MERNITLDYFKLICAFLVITIHTDIAANGFGGWAIEHGIARIAVPCFLVINGYFLFPVMKDRKKFGRYLIHILLLMSVWSLVYYNYNLSKLSTWHEVLGLVFVKGYLHLWYLVSLLYAAVILYFVRRLPSGVLLAVSFLLFSAGFIISRYDQFGLDYYLTLRETRTFLFIGFPFVCTGYCIHKMQLAKKKINDRLLILLSVFFAVCLIGETTFQYVKHVTPAGFSFYTDFYASLIFLCPLLILTILRTGRHQPADGYVSDLASGIYFGHLLILVMVRQVWGRNDLFNFPLVMFLSVILAAGIIAVNKRLKIFL